MMQVKMNCSSNYMKFYFLFVITFLFFCLRNLDPILYPTVYAEDAVWTGNLIDKGFWDTAFHTRVFPILGFVLFYKTALILINFFCSGNLFYLPLVYFILSNIFLALCVLAAYLACKNLLSRAGLICLIAAMILMPVGYDGNEIYGRILNLGFLFPVLHVLMLTAIFFNRQSTILISMGLLVSLISCLTLPVGVGLQLVFGVISAYIGYKEKNSLFYILATASVIIVIVSVASISTTAIHDNGGADFPLKVSSLIEFVIARVLLYPFVSGFYQNLNDFLVLLFFFFFAIVTLASFRYAWQENKLNDKSIAIIFIWFSFGVYFFSIIIMRRGLSSLFTDYTSTFPDRYFLGINTLFVVAILVTVHRTVFSKPIILFTFFSMLLSINNIFELNKPAMKMNNSSLWTTEFCAHFAMKENDKKGLLINVPPEKWIFNSETFNVSEEQIKKIKERCEVSYLYNLPVLSSLQPDILVLRNMPVGIVDIPALSLSAVHNVAITWNGSQFGVKVTGDDPYIIFNAKSQKHTYSHLVLHFNIFSPVEAKFQAYYKTIGMHDYAEDKSIFFELNKGDNSVYFDLKNNISSDNIRIDLPDGSSDEFFFNINNVLTE